MIFGDKENFAVETDKEMMIFCKFCLWLKGHMIGDLDVVAGLAPFSGALEFFLSMEDKRVDDELYTLPLDDLINLIYGAVFGEESDAASEEILANHKRFSPMIFAPNLIEALDDHFVVVISSEKGDRVAWKSLDSSEQAEAYLEKGAFNRLIQDAINWFKN